MKTNIPGKHKLGVVRLALTITIGYSLNAHDAPLTVSELNIFIPYDAFVINDLVGKFI